MKRFAVALTILLLSVATQAYGATLTFKQVSTTDDEKAVAQVFEKMAATALKDARGSAELYTQDAVIKWFFGPRNEERVTEGRDKIYVLFSTANVQKVDFRDIVIKVEGDRAEATGQTSTTLYAAGLNWLRQEERIWKLRREPEGWRIYYREARNSVMTRQ